MHIHAAQIERFTVLRGTLGVRAGRETRMLGPGEVVEVAAGTPHTLWNAGNQECVHRVEMMPALATEDYFHEVITLEAEGGVPPKSLAHLVAYGFMGASGALCTVAMFANIFLGSRLHRRWCRLAS
jgi:hypothetical protein